MMKNSLDNLSELTIVIPSYEREDYLKRQILFWSNYSAKIVILDGSKKSLSKDSILENKTNIIYFHLPVSIEERFKFGIRFITSAYAILLPDDEFYVPTALASCITFLKENKDFVSCKGQTIYFDYQKNKILAKEHYEGLLSYQVSENEPHLRMNKHMSDYEMVSLYSVIKSDAFKKTLQTISYYSNFKSAVIAEIQTSLIVSFLGKCATIKELMWFRSGENDNIWWTQAPQSFLEWFKDENNKKEIEIFFKSILSSLDLKFNKENKKPFEIALNKFIDDANQKIYEKNLKQKTYSNRSKLFIKKILKLLFFNKFNFLINLIRKSNDLVKVDKVLQVLEKKDIYIDPIETNNILIAIQKFHKYKEKYSFLK